MTKPNPRSVPQSAQDEPNNQIVADYVRTFNTPHGRRVLAHIEQRAYSAFRLDQDFKNKSSNQTNPAFMNPYAAVYRSAQVDVVQRARRLLKKGGVELGFLEHSNITDISEEG